MNCKRCGNYISNPSEPCSICGEINSIETPIYEKEVIKEYLSPKERRKRVGLIFLVILFMFVSIISVLFVLKPKTFKFDFNDNQRVDVKTIDTNKKDTTENETKEKRTTDTSTNNKNAIDNSTSNSDNKTTTTDNEEESDIVSDKEKFLSNSKIVKKINAKSSKNLLSESEVIEFVNNKGFKNVNITYDVDMNGDLVDETEVDKNSNVKHPMYTFHYVSGEDIWTLYVIEKRLYAYPISYIYNNNPKVSVLLSEYDTMVSYDYYDNNFYYTIPNSDEVNLVIVKSITPKELDKFK